MHKGYWLSKTMLMLLVGSIFLMSFAAMASYPKTLTDTQGREITLEMPLRG